MLHKLQRTSSLARELTWTLVLKTAALVLIWWTMFRPDSDAPVTVDDVGRYVLDDRPTASDASPTSKDTEP
jgi:hypothetical protein